MVNFGPPDLVSGGDINDDGSLFAKHGDKSYGWTCDITCRWCSFNDAKPPTDATFLTSIGDACKEDDFSDRRWEINVPNGIYEIQTLHDTGRPSDVQLNIHHCNVEGVQLVDVNKESIRPVTLRRRVKVTDGALTLDGKAAKSVMGQCQVINKLSFKKVANALKEIWMTSKADPWWQIELSEPTKIGVVQVVNFDPIMNDFSSKTKKQVNCATWWLFRGGHCDEGQPLGWFNASDEGAVVGVSDKPCSGRSCGGGTVCGRITKNRIGRNEYYVDCKGVVGKYVYVQLPGSGRIFPLDVQVNRYRPDSVTPGARACYGVEAREMTSTTPEYIVTSDPEDPIFYSTCYVREPNIKWLGREPQAPPSRWRYQNHCLDCSVYHENKQVKSDPFGLPALWQMADGHCIHCDNEPTPPMPADTPWLQIATGVCDTFDGADDDDPPPITCTDRAACRKQLAPGGRLDGEQGDPWDALAISLEECKILAAKDPECSSTMYWDSKWKGCYCWKKEECCQRCRPGPTWGKDYQVFDTTPAYATPDPTCKNGLKSEAGDMCCPKHCVNSEGKSVCGKLWECHMDSVGGGQCCAKNTINNCKDAGAPCLL